MRHSPGRRCPCLRWLECPPRCTSSSRRSPCSCRSPGPSRGACRFSATEFQSESDLFIFLVVPPPLPILPRTSMACSKSLTSISPLWLMSAEGEEEQIPDSGYSADRNRFQFFPLRSIGNSPKNTLNTYSNFLRRNSEIDILAEGGGGFCFGFLFGLGHGDLHARKWRNKRRHVNLNSSSINLLIGKRK